MSDLQAYYSRFARRLWQDAGSWARDNVLLALVMVAMPLVVAALLRLGKQDWQFLRITIACYAALFLLYLAVHWMRTPWKLDQAREQEIEGKQAEITAFREKAVPRFRVSEVIARPISTNQANDNRIYVQIVLDSLSDMPVINCRGFLKTIWRRSEAGEWEKTQADELLDLLWSVKDIVVHTIPPRSPARLNLLWFGSLNQHINLCLERTPHYVLPIVQTKDVLRFDIYITADDCPPANVSIGVQKGSEWDNPRVELLGNGG
jgi:hypothetical protein